MNGRSHQAATIALAVPAGVAGYLLADCWQSGAIAAAGCLAGLWMHPDRDLPAAKVDYQIGLLGLPGAIFWAAYAWAVPHRSWFSHWPIVGTAGRLAYVLGLAWLVAWLAGVDLVVWLAAVDVAAVALFVGGLAVADAAHWVMDW